MDGRVLPVSLPAAAPRVREARIDRYVRASGKLDLDGIEFDSVRRWPLPDEALRTLTYMMDVEGYTIVYLRDLLNTSVVDDPEIGRFLTLWAYEEMFHSEALERFLAAYGVRFDSGRRAELRRKEDWFNRASMSLASFASRVLPDFAASYLAWGAINELSTLHGYGLLAERAAHPVLSEILRRIVKDERRHFSFYYWQARRRLESKAAQRITAMVVRRFWRPVGAGVKSDGELGDAFRYLLSAPSGRDAVRSIDRTIAALPGLGWFRGMQEAYDRELGARGRGPGSGGPMNDDEAKRSLIRSGFVLFLLGMLTGFAIPAFSSPREGLSAHLAAVQSALFLIVLGLAWSEIRLPARVARASMRLAQYACFGNWAWNALNAILATHEATPLAGAGLTGASPWEEKLVLGLLGTTVLSITAAAAMFVWGMLGAAASRAKPAAG